MKLGDFFSERMVFGVLIIVGFIVILHEMIYEGTPLRPEIVSIVAGGIGALGAAVGIIVQAIWKSDKADKTNANSLALLAAKATDQSPSPQPGTPTEPVT